MKVRFRFPPKRVARASPVYGLPRMDGAGGGGVADRKRASAPRDGRSRAHWWRRVLTSSSDRRHFPFMSASTNCGHSVA
jgi:hypothetical protein